MLMRAVWQGSIRAFANHKHRNICQCTNKIFILLRYCSQWIFFFFFCVKNYCLMLSRTAEVGQNPLRNSGELEIRIVSSRVKLPCYKTIILSFDFRFYSRAHYKFDTRRIKKLRRGGVDSILVFWWNCVIPCSKVVFCEKRLKQSHSLTVSDV